MHSRALALFELFLLVAARRSIHVGNSHLHVQQQISTLSDNLEVSAEARDAFLPRAFGTAQSRNKDPQTGAGHAGNLTPRPSKLGKRRSSVVPMAIGSDDAGAFQEDALSWKTRRSIIAAALPLSFLFSDVMSAGAAGQTYSAARQNDLQQVLSMMSSWDKDKDGTLTRTEFEKGMLDDCPAPLSQAQLDQLWARIEKAQNRLASDPSFAGNTLSDEVKQRPQPGQPIPLPTDRVKSSIPKESGGYYQYPSPQQFFNAQTRKGTETDVYVAETMVKIHNSMNEAGWATLLRYEAVTHPEFSPKDVKMRKFRGNAPNRPKGSFDQHRWTIVRGPRGEGGETTYVLDYYNIRKYDGRTMPFAPEEVEIRAQPDPLEPAYYADIAKYEKAKGKSYSSTSDLL